MSYSGSQMLIKVIRHIPLIILSVLFLFPMYWLFSSSLKPNNEMFTIPPVLFTRHIQWSRYAEVFTYLPFLRFIGNSFIIAFLNILGLLLSCPMAAYAFSRLRWRGREALFAAFLMTMMLPGQVTMIPLYLFYKSVGVTDSWIPLTVPSFFGNAFNIFLVRQFFLTLPNELEDAAKIDGAGYWRCYWNIMLPLIQPILLTIAVFTFMASWNDFMGPMIYINTVDKMPIALGLQLFRSLHNSEFGLLMSASSLMTIPPVVLFFLAQRQFIKGIAFSGLKG